MNRKLEPAKATRTSGFFILLGVTLFLLGGCEEEDRYLLRFSHQMHSEDLGLACEDCHGELTADGFSSPDHDSCTICHEDWIEADEISEDTCGMCHVEKDLATIGEAPEETVWSRFRHSEELAGDCMKCHGDLFGQDIEFVKKMTDSDRLELRNEAHSWGRECSVCHEELDRDVPPESHEIAWTEKHGLEYGRDTELCSVCHEEESCHECHQQQAPSSHNNLFRIKTHGIEASWARERCQVCHKDDFCITCHQETRPRSHTGAWSQRHCRSCHSFQEGGSGCATCHPGGIENPSHNLVIPHEIYEFNCNFCHGPVDGVLDQRLRIDPFRHPFIDDTQCLNCHRP